MSESDSETKFDIENALPILMEEVKHIMTWKRPKGRPREEKKPKPIKEPKKRGRPRKPEPEVPPPPKIKQKRGPKPKPKPEPVEKVHKKRGPKPKEKGPKKPKEQNLNYLINNVMALINQINELKKAENK